MPNWVMNEVRFEGGKADLDKIENLVKSEDSEFSFDKVIPVPDSMYPEAGPFGYVSGNSTEQILAYLTDGGKKDISDIDKNTFKKYLSERENDVFSFSIGRSEDFFENKLSHIRSLSDEDVQELCRIGEAKISNLDTYGVYDWYSFCVNFWGTKWDASSVSMDRIDDNTLRYFFDTAWAIPSGIYSKLQKMFPEVKITLLYADEDWGNNCGFIQGKGEEIFAWPSDNESNVDSETLITFSRYIWEGDNAFAEDEYLEMDPVDRDEFFKSIPEEVARYMRS